MKEKEMHSLFFKHKFVKVTPYLRRFGHRLSGMIMPNLSTLLRGAYCLWWLAIRQGIYG